MSFYSFFSLYRFIMFLVSGQYANAGSIVYTCDELLALSKPPPFTVTGRRYQILEKLRRRNRRCRAGVMRKARRRRPCIPSIVMGNVRLLVNKVDELGALIRSLSEYRECSLMCSPRHGCRRILCIYNIYIFSMQTQL